MYVCMRVRKCVLYSAAQKAGSLFVFFLNPSNPLVENTTSICKLREDFRCHSISPAPYSLSLPLSPVFGSHKKNGIISHSGKEIGVFSGVRAFAKKKKKKFSSFSCINNMKRLTVGAFPGPVRTRGLPVESSVLKMSICAGKYLFL